MGTTTLKNKVALVSGSSMGIGKAIALELANKEVKIVLNGKDSEKLQQTHTEFIELGFDAIAIKADIRDPVQCKYLITKTIRTYGKIDILVNNAGLSSRGTVEEMAELNFKALIETNYTGTAYLCKYAIPHLKKTKGHIIFINSAGGFRGMPYNSAYTASKMAQTGLAEALRIELYDADIHVGVVYVGFTENDPRKTILDVDGTLVYLPKRTNIHLAKPQSVAHSVRCLIEKRKYKVTLTGLGNLANFMTHYLPGLGNWIIRIHRKKIKKQFTYINGQKVSNIKEEEKSEVYAEL